MLAILGGLLFGTLGGHALAGQWLWIRIGVVAIVWLFGFATWVIDRGRT